MLSKAHIYLIVLLLQGAAGGLAAEEFALRDGDTVVFLGDSITAARGYTKIVEHYTLMRYPERNVRFVNAGQGGDTAQGCLTRLERDVFDKGATVVTVAFGVNDIGWGINADAEHKQQYLDGIRSIVERCQSKGIRVYICSAAITAEPPDAAAEGFLQAMTDEGLALARKLGAGTVDLQRGMREVQRRVLAANEQVSDDSKHTHLHVADGVHLNELGHLAMAYALLKGLGAPSGVSDATLDAASETVDSTNGCTVSQFVRLEQGLSFVRQDTGLPLNLGIFSSLNYRWVPLHQGLNQYLLTIKNLPEGSYEVVAEGRAVGTATATQLAAGLNLASMTADPWQPGGPWDAQSNLVKELVDARDHLEMNQRLRLSYLANHPAAATLDLASSESIEKVMALQRATAKPYPYRFEIRRVPDSDDKR